ncbi:MAG: transposase [Planctomycetota bacterium]|jgi:REP element-mobilizing transposase RayT
MLEIKTSGAATVHAVVENVVAPDEIGYNCGMSQKSDPNVRSRRSVRLPGYHYSEEGWYFVTICAQGHRCVFGRIVEDEMCLEPAGTMIETWWRELVKKFPSVRPDAHVVMPNHFHGIIYVGATLCGRPGFDNACESKGRPHGVAPTLGRIVSWFKTMTTNGYIRGVKQDGWPPFPGRLWQRNYYEHIIRNENELNHYRAYIADNPANWRTDEENPDL